MCIDTPSRKRSFSDHRWLLPKFHSHVLITRDLRRPPAAGALHVVGEQRARDLSELPRVGAAFRARTELVHAHSRLSTRRYSASNSSSERTAVSCDVSTA